MRRLAWVGAAAWMLATGVHAQTDPTLEARSLWGILWEGVEWPAWFIIAGSFVAITLIAEHFLTIRRSTVTPAAQVALARELVEKRRFRECLDRLGESSTFFARVMTASLQHARHGFDAMRDAAVEKSGELSGRMFRKAEYLNILGNLGPLMGLLGTVWGMIIAFGSLGQTGGGADAGMLARGISLALVNTLLGLLLGVVGIGSFGVCRNRIDSFTVQATVEALDLLEYFRPSAGTTAAVPRSEATAASPAPPPSPARSAPAAPPPPRQPLPEARP